MIYGLVGVILLGLGFFTFKGGDKVEMNISPKAPLIDYNENFYTRYDNAFKFYASLEGFDWRMLKAIAIRESSLGQDPRVLEGKVSFDGLSYGLMQIAEGKGSQKEIEIKGFGGALSLNNPEYSIEVASRLVGYLNQKYGDPRTVFLAYNQGEKNTDNEKDFSKKWHNGQSYGDLVMVIYNKLLTGEKAV